MWDHNTNSFKLSDPGKVWVTANTLGNHTQILPSMTAPNYITREHLNQGAFRMTVEELKTIWRAQHGSEWVSTKNFTQYPHMQPGDFNSEMLFRLLNLHVLEKMWLATEQHEVVRLPE